MLMNGLLLISLSLFKSFKYEKKDVTYICSLLQKPFSNRDKSYKFSVTYL